MNYRLELILSLAALTFSAWMLAHAVSTIEEKPRRVKWAWFFMFFQLITALVYFFSIYLRKKPKINEPYLEGRSP